MPTFRATISYDGTAFHGWQIQPGLRTVQEIFESALSGLAGLPRVRVTASGRTDTGVHAIGQVVSFVLETKLEPNVLRRAINARLPEDVIVRRVDVVPDGFDANRDARRKRYRYVIHDGEVPDLFQRRYAHHSRYRLDAERMHHAGQALLGTHDFRCFETEWPNRASSVRTITHISVERPAHLGGEFIWLEVEADGFLYNMVRAIAGTLMQVGRGYWPVEYVEWLVREGDRTQAGPTAPACGLFLLYVVYEEASRSESVFSK
ncbi:MAG: tRNA pseudouridine(38-40) synthase TruA [Gemmataceae bacterium]